MLKAHVEYETAKRHYAHVDCPGHADYVKVRPSKYAFSANKLRFFFSVRATIKVNLIVLIIYRPELYLVFHLLLLLLSLLPYLHAHPDQSELKKE